MSGGRGAPFVPTEEQRRTVRAMAGFGIPQPDIATLLEIDPKTLRKHFRRELDRGSIEATAKVAQSLFAMATSGRNVAAAIFWMKARAGWREKAQVEHSLAARPLTVITGVPRAQDLSDDQLARIVVAGGGALDEADDEDDEEEGRAGAEVINVVFVKPSEERGRERPPPSLPPVIEHEPRE